MSINFEGKVAIVTGAGNGLGRSHAMELAARGAKVVVNDFGGSVDGQQSGSNSPAEQVVEEIKALGGEAVANPASVTDVAAVQQMVNDTVERWGRIDILINNAGILRDKTFTKVSLEDFAAVVDVHLNGSIICSKAVWDQMISQNYGRIVMTTSAAGLYGNFGQSNYAAAKLGAVGLMNALRLEGRKYNVKVNTIAPMAFSRMTKDLMAPGVADSCKPELVSSAVVFLCSEDAPTGEIISAGAGAYTRVQYIEADAVYLGPETTADDVSSAWEKISDMSNAKVVTDVGASMKNVLSKLPRKK
ncbi:MAG: SDR family NAD(P)-dependent oxidoreductase [Pseudomonadales bacterium]|nr:SDR family NAD(P)-dependent oxidoreductase [Pseudomonadales bacterium]